MQGLGVIPYVYTLKLLKTVKVGHLATIGFNADKVGWALMIYFGEAARQMWKTLLVFSIQMVLLIFLWSWLPHSAVQSGQAGTLQAVAGSCRRLPSTPSLNSFAFLVLLPVSASYSWPHTPLFCPTPTPHNAPGIKLGPAKSSDMLITRLTLL